MLRTRALHLVLLTCASSFGLVVACGGSDSTSPVDPSAADGSTTGPDGGPNGGDGSTTNPDGGGTDAPITTTTLSSSLSAGSDLACALDAQNALKCWGAGKSTPEVVTPGTAYKTLDIGQQSACAIRASDSSLVCWTTRSYAPATKDTGQFTDVAVGSLHQCALNTAGALFCWGFNNVGQLGTGDTQTQANLAPVDGGATDWASVRAGATHTCALKKSGALYCWGSNAADELGNGNGGFVDGGAVFEVAPIPIAAGTTWKEIDLGASMSCGIRSDGALMCWGRTLTAGNVKTPTPLDSARDWLRVRVDQSHACALKGNGAIYCWGSNYYGQLGDGTRTNRTSPQQVGGDLDWTDVAVGTQFSCGTKKDGSVRCWGHNGAGQLGVGTPDHLSPTKVGAGADWNDVSASGSGACGVKKAGANLACWGLGLGLALLEQTPLTIGAGTTWATLTRGNNHACVRATNNVLSCWGSNSQGESGVGPTPRTVPLPSSTGLPALRASAGVEHTCAVHTDQSLYCWGDDIFGKSTTTGDSNVPKKVGADLWKRVSSGGYASCGIKADGTLWCWGFGLNDPMELMSADTTWTEVATGAGASSTHYAIKAGVLHSFTRNSAPVPIGAQATWATIALGASHYCGAHTNGTMWCAGTNTSGQIGDGTTITRALPVQVGLATDWTHATVGNAFSCGLRNGGELYCWGANEAGQLADGSAWSQVPVLVK